MAMNDFFYTQKLLVYVHYLWQVMTSMATWYFCKMIAIIKLGVLLIYAGYIVNNFRSIVWNEKF